MTSVPIHFGPGDRPLFGVLDAGRAPRRRVGVLLLNPVGWEYLRAHRTLRQLALRLAEAGFDVLRFDYSGTGDSGGDLADGITLDDWRRDVDEALDELGAMAGTSRFSLVGLRTGALLAAEAATRRADLEHVVLWDPPVIGDAVLTPRSSQALRELDVDAPLPTSAIEGDEAALAPPPPLQARLRAIEIRRPADARTRLHLAWSSDEATTPPWLAQRVDSELRVPGSPVCWVEERTFGAGAVPVPLLTRLVQVLAA